MLDCEVYGYPIPNISWYKANTLIISDDDDDDGSGVKYDISHYVIPDNIMQSKLRIEVLEYEDNGEYMCEAVNFLFEQHIVPSNRGTVDVHCKRVY